MQDEKPYAATIWDAHERRIIKLEDGMDNLSRSMLKIEQDMRTNNQITSEIRDDTKEIRDLVKGAKAFGKIAAWGGSVLALLVAAYTLGLIPR